MNRQCYLVQTQHIRQAERERLGLREGQTHTHRNKGKAYDRKGKR